MQRVPDPEEFAVVRRGAGPLSIWPAGHPLPAGWELAPCRGTRRECLAWIDRHGQVSASECPPGAANACTHSGTVMSLFAAALERGPDRPAVSDDERSLTYRELNEASTRLARGLLRREMTPEQPIAILLARGVDVLVAVLGIVRAGGAYVPIDVRQPARHRSAMIDASGARRVITTPELWGGAPGCDAETVRDLVTAGEHGTDLPEVRGCQAACILFTSGSSGQPKPIVLEHRNLCYLAANPALPELGPQDRVAQVSRLSFDAFSYEVWCSLAAGAHIRILPSLADLVAGDVQRELRRHRITAMLAPTMAVNHVVSEDVDAFSSLRILATGGDVIRPAACRDLLTGSFAGQFFNLYGPTEATTACTAYRIGQVPAGEDTVPIGTAFAGAAVHLLDEHMMPVPDGTTGELHIGGDGVARGYLGLPGLTAERFRPDPWAPDGERMYATGDLARRRPDGLIEFLGRQDSQVKVRGYRVEPLQAERVLLRHDGVRDAAVVVTGQGDAAHLLALVVAEGPLSLAKLRTYAAETLPDYLVPSAFMAVDRIPANDHGKRDLAALREMARTELRRRRAAVAPRDDIERYLAGIWAELLVVEQVGVDDDFFELGGNSMLAFRLRKRIARDLDIALDTEQVLTRTVLSDVAALLRESSASGAGRSG